jgi:hypothetical protein
VQAPARLGIVQRYQRFSKAEAGQPPSGSGSPVLGAIELARAAAAANRTIVLVEGISDLLALTTLAERHGRNLDAEGITVIAMGGATNIGRFLNLLGPRGLGANLAGLCDAGEEHRFRRALARAGFGADLTRSDMERLGFFVCDADLEDELIRALGVEAMLDVVAAQGELGAFRALQKQPAWQHRGIASQLRRWLGAGSQRKHRYAVLLVEALDRDRVPAPLDRLLTHIARLD